MKKITPILIGFAAAGLMFCGCETGEGQGERPVSEAIRVVKDTISPKIVTWDLEFQEGPLAGGTTVLVDGDAAYWVDSAGDVFAANGTAKTWSAAIDWSPTGIDLDSVTAAVAGDAEDDANVEPPTPLPTREGGS